MKASGRITVAIAAICIALLTLTGTSAQQGLVPPQCDPEQVMDLHNISFLGPARSIQVGNITFSYHDFGPLDLSEVFPSTPDTSIQNSTNSPAPVVFIHGYGSTQYDWPFDLLQNVAASRRVIIFDNPRIGWSNDTSNETLTVQYMANATGDLIHALPLQRPDIVGYSMGGDVALTLAADHGDQIGSVVAIAASFGGPRAPQPTGGLEMTLQRLHTLMASKYTPTTASPTTTASATSFVSPFAYSSKVASTTDQTDQTKLFFPQGMLDPGACNMLRDYYSLAYAVGLLPIDNYTGYALPGIVYPEGIVPSPWALVPTEDTLNQQSNAILLFHTQDSAIASSLAGVDRQIMFISGIQDNVIPVTTQLQASGLCPGSWLVQIPDAGHAIPFNNPDELGSQITSFLDSAQDISPITRSYYQTPTSSAGFDGIIYMNAKWMMFIIFIVNALVFF